MAYTTNKLITNAFYLANIVSRDYETLSGSQISEGLDLLNEVLNDKVVDQSLVPYESKYFFNVEAGREVYFIPNLIQIDTLTFSLNNVRYSMQYSARNKYQGSGRVNNISSFPYAWFFERQNEGGNLYIYFKPDNNYRFEINGVFRLSNVSLNQDLSETTNVVNLGLPSILTSPFLSIGQFVVNDVDLQGVYESIGSLTNYINTGIVEGVRSKIDQFGNFILYSDTKPPTIITIKTNGIQPNGSSFVNPVNYATTGSLPLSTYNNGISGVGSTITGNLNGLLSIDGSSVVLNDKVLVKNQVNSFENGVYNVTQTGSGVQPFILTRQSSYDQAFEISIGTYFEVLSGSTNQNTYWIMQSSVREIGVSDINFNLFQSLTFENYSLIEDKNIQTYLSTKIDDFYISYLKYALADRICSNYNVETPLKVDAQLKEYIAIISKQSRLVDMSMTKKSTLNKKNALNWAFVNLGRGWYPN